ncbi:hypothetical protein KC343_g4325 [Hortaea werneckii]|uniref:Uncharacterized protein n=1 Tax=Hortaea werneckii TaxID=91943 RepID=A0A3M7E5X2_HORWE|nr:hypothetical protein KC352_g26668 [Hortaea werneckii]KAI7548046.1 hypothetical protein KC317_g14957 [Hortaea werneckii]KAI7597172.1 hypothetical protein KC346_g14800 [Hortaea werneckii]KAI7630944.1 hypothetical protein KC343_g4325 [Hortaea werneckii]KAI7638969.1 hypothetical protein KC319_g14612 [Hortaea werneckii]
MATQLSLPVIKYSHALGVRPDNTPPWSHILGDNLYVIVKGADTKTDDGRLQPDGKLNMTIMEGNRLLESVDIAGLVDEALAARSGAERVGVMPAVEQLPIFGITREALLALRYKSRSGEARRIQLRLKSASDCRQIVSAFERRGMEFQEHRPQTSRPSTARPPTAGAASDRPFTGHASSPYFEPVKSPQKPSVFNPQTIEGGSLSQSPKRSAHEAFGKAESQAMTPHFFRRDETIAPREISPERPPTSLIYRSNTTPFQHSQYGMTMPQQPSFQRPSSSSEIATVEAVRRAVEEDAAHSRPTRDMEPQYAHESYPPAVSRAERSALGSSSNNGTRPSTGLPPINVCTVPPPDSQEFTLPPKRELPFKRPDSRRESDRTNSRPNSSALTMPPLPKPKLVKENPNHSTQKGSVTQAEELEQMRPISASPSKYASAAQQNVEVLRPQTTATQHYSGQALLGREQQAKIAYTPRPGLTADRAVNGSNASHYHPLAERLPNKVSRVSSLVDAPHEIDDSPPRPLSPPKTLYQASDPQDPSDSAAASLRVLRRHDPHEVSVEEYATQSREERQAALETFMLANLENPAFAKLCEDVENCWRRIALGL